MLVSWGLRTTTYITNILVLVGYALLFNWLQNTRSITPRWQRWRQPALVAVTIAFVVLFHFSSVLSMAAQNNPIGYGWTYLNFQGATLLYALLSSRQRLVLYFTSLVVVGWYWWIPRVPTWPLMAACSLVLMYVATRFGPTIGRRALTYYPFGFLFMAPFFLANWLSLDGIDVGWPWQVITLTIILWCLWQTHYRFVARRNHEAALVSEAQIDDLTSLKNFRVFDADLHAAFDRLQDHGELYALYTFDIDHFKRVNDTYGHVSGNTILQAVAKRLEQVVANFDYPAQTYRTGGEEFSFLLIDVVEDFGKATEYTTAVKDALSDLTFHTENGDEFHITVSIGQDRSVADDRNYLDIYKRADKYLYSSKNHGRNAITIRGITIGQAQRVQARE
ncbi:Signal transduction diguanylate cyclase [Lacticaseibacillus pantheris DSM 15945 = JCM 12539 = NBRC 106106]|uniref:Signal transduction diguanylate cyclase n=1 Tax=Lacticaseibacillus pantheris DSM 15945 = JCM 12539 = NBRC 106106 TaxID=1423783 RepID=A0A0R1TWU6_9LACO|nr:GGDEF domain-containing protein [Lacticaseibacillus pantheris]KRL85655.1 Signal transduction diguanylate cyclase [Lacticaseibacillus pantheris DSM 15945 = JCM 12539 = NBRC 106106]